jgi:hypothetical protein
LVMKCKPGYADKGGRCVKARKNMNGQNVPVLTAIRGHTERLSTPGSWKSEVIADDSGQWTTNALRFATKEEAEAYVSDLSSRWFLVRETRAVPSTDPINYKWVPGKGVQRIE